MQCFLTINFNSIFFAFLHEEREAHINFHLNKQIHVSWLIKNPEAKIASLLYATIISFSLIYPHASTTDDKYPAFRRQYSYSFLFWTLGIRASEDNGAMLSMADYFSKLHQKLWTRARTVSYCGSKQRPFHQRLLRPTQAHTHLNDLISAVIRLWEKFIGQSLYDYLGGYA